MSGVSLGALATAFAIDRWKVAVDMGRCSALLAAQETVLLTHCHSDHVAGLLAWLSSRTRPEWQGRARIVVPARRRDELVAALSSWPDLDRVRRLLPLERVITGAEPGDRVELAGGWARAFRTHHSVPSLGWQLGPAAEQRPRLVVTGDTTVQPFAADAGLLDAAVAVVDCSMVRPGARLLARLSGHSHLRDWLELLPGLPCDHLVLAHLPPDSTVAELRDLLQDLPYEGPTVTPWLAAGG